VLIIIVSIPIARSVKVKFIAIYKSNIKYKVLLLGIKASGYHIRYIAITYSKLPLRVASFYYILPQH
jgi:hypothetical protein